MDDKFYSSKRYRVRLFFERIADIFAGLVFIGFGVYRFLRDDLIIFWALCCIGVSLIVGSNTFKSIFNVHSRCSYGDELGKIEFDLFDVLSSIMFLCGVGLYVYYKYIF